MTQATGRCLCGAVNFTASDFAREVETCHCAMCRKWGGGPLMVVACGQAVTFDGEEHIRVYDSSPWAERGFCSRCGSHLFYRLKEINQHQIPAGLFDDQQGFSMTLQVYIDKKPDFYCFRNQTEEMTEREVIDKYAPDSGL